MKKHFLILIMLAAAMLLCGCGSTGGSAATTTAARGVALTFKDNRCSMDAENFELALPAESKLGDTGVVFCSYSTKELANEQIDALEGLTDISVEKFDTSETGSFIIMMITTGSGAASSYTVSAVYTNHTTSSYDVYVTTDGGVDASTRKTHQYHFVEVSIPRFYSKVNVFLDGAKVG